MVAQPIEAAFAAASPLLSLPLRRRLERYSPASPLGLRVVEALPYLPDELALELLDSLQSSTVIHTKLWGTLYQRDDSEEKHPDAVWDPRWNLWVTDFGVLSEKVVTTAGVNFLVDAFQNSTELEIVEFHGIGTGTTAAASGDTDIETELTTQYVTNNTRATGTNAEGSSANIYQTVATNEVDASVAVTEHGVLTNATVGSGTLFDRHVFSAVNMVSGNLFQTTYEATFSAGG